MFFEDALDHHLVSTEPRPLYMGELPGDYADCPARVIVNACGAFPRSTPLGHVVLTFALQDSLDATLTPERVDVERFLRVVHEYAEREPTYWHCHAGINRSGFLTAIYLHLYRGLTISQAIDNLRKRRSNMVLCNGTFERTLRDWYGAPEERDFQPFSLETWLREREGARKA